MKRNIVAFILLAGLGAFSLRAQSPRPELFDTRKSQQELEIMRGIIGTTLDFAARETHGDKGKGAVITGQKAKIMRLGWGGHGVEAYYFYGQGATFLVPMSGIRLGVLAELDHQFADVAWQIEAAQEVAYAEATKAYEAADAAIAAPPAPPEPPQAPSEPPRPPQPAKPAVAATPRPAPAPAAARGDARKRLAEAQEQVKKRRELSQERRKELLEMVERAKDYLIEAVANHGDSLTFLKPNEYINVVISTDGGDLLGESETEGRQIVSVQKSVITDYKAGRLSLDAFKQKVLQYTN